VSASVRPRRLYLAIALAASAVAMGVLAGPAAAAVKSAYTVHNLTSNVAGVADHTDTNLQNAWGLDAGPTNPWWIADNATNLSTVYTGDGAPFLVTPSQPLVVTVDGGPTGLVFNPTSSSFTISDGAGHSGKAIFLFDGEDGVIRGWNPTVPPPVPPSPVSTQTEVAVPNSTGAIYKGLAISANPDRLYAADFHNARVDVFDGTFTPIENPGQFTDPNLPAGFAPFGIQRVGDQIMVAYAKQDADAEDEVAGQGLGFVDAYDLNGGFIGRIAQRGQLNAPWGLAMAPDDFGRFSGDLLVGNFGDGAINAYAPESDGTWRPAGQLRDSSNKPIRIDGLWALQFGRGGANNGPTNTLFFTAGPNDETDGLFGSITAG
jgi:uncharacterized protein (TIGR03118 family)